MGLARKTAEAIERKLKKSSIREGNPESREISGIKRIQKGKVQNVYRDNALKQVITEEKEQKEAALLRILEAGYDEMAVTLQRYDFKDHLPSKIEVMEAIKKLGSAMLKEISRFGKPTILITPRGSFESKIHALDGHKFKGNWGKNCVRYCNPAPNDNHWGAKQKKMIVSVVDGCDVMPNSHTAFDGLTIGERLDKEEAEYAGRNLDIMDHHEYVMLVMLFQGRKKIIDYPWCTKFNRKKLKNDKLVSGGSQVVFNTSPASDHVVGGFRPSVKVMEV